MKKYRVLMAALCAAFLLCGMTAPAYAYSDEPTGGYEETDPAATVEDTTVEEAPTPEPTLEPGEGFSEEGNLVTRDLLYDKHTNKQFITVQTSGGSTFYIVIDYDKPVDEEGEQYETYFLGVVDEADLLAAFEAAGGELPACSCTEKCAAGAVNTDCPVCATNMTECAGVEPEPEPEPEPAEDPEPEAEAGGGSLGLLAMVLAAVVICGGAGWYFKIYRPKQERAAQAEEDYDEPDPYEESEDYDPYGEDEYGDEEETEENN
ncbi:DUF4366 domain-containing protein [Pseudoflavonifractor sp. AF19-9AC]|uniref:DUF4366 domain-containing protein n=1 Tax=Pseudoflavonifractor sp. AF19-9AC TaxID=2292244 RepID=UPI000E53A365|nr:DUF4366 domain-containing protein [Pseudoflavonifractor sp. AF19-9AC]RHR04996.1 DUF4366 domain-containing protein [Pseudoflavonifractor sp. AF19-9AC]